MEITEARVTSGVENGFMRRMYWNDDLINMLVGYDITSGYGSALT